MTVLLILEAVAILLWAIFFSTPRVTVGRLFLLFSLAMIHTLASVYYFYWSKTALTDASAYYFDSSGIGNSPFQIGTTFVFQLTGYLRDSLGATYFQCFMFFQMIGFAGIVILFRVFSEIQSKLVIDEKTEYLTLLCLPSLSFWTSMIGKDAPLFSAVSLCVWSMLNLRKRLLYLCASLAVMTLFRAHIAFIAVAALALTAFLDMKMTAARKAGLLVLAACGIVLLAGPVEQSIGLDISSVDSVTQFVEKQNAASATIAGGTGVANAPYVFRLFSLLFRPLFFDAPGLMGIVASVENLGAIAAFFYILSHGADFKHLFKKVFFFRYVVVFSTVLLCSLALVYYNVGLGIRERVMAYPSFFAILVSLWAFVRMRASSRRQAQPSDNAMATMPSSMKANAVTSAAMESTRTGTAR